MIYTTESLQKVLSLGFTFHGYKTKKRFMSDFIFFIWQPIETILDVMSQIEFV